MTEFKELKLEEFKTNPFDLIGNQWMLITAAREGKVNTMTAAWGGLGIMWGKNVVHIVIRPQRYTKEFVDASERFSLSFYEKEYKPQLGYLGKVSGRDEDKVAKSGLTAVYDGDTPYFEEAELVIICKKLFSQRITPDSFIDSQIDEKWYPDKDYHSLYFGEVEKILVKQ